MRLPSRRTFTSVPAGKTVSMCAATRTTSFSFAPRSSATTFPVLSIWTGTSDSASKSLMAAARWASWKGGAGISVRRACWSLIQGTFGVNQSSAARTRGLSESRKDGTWPTEREGARERTGIAKRIAQKSASLTAAMFCELRFNFVRPQRKEPRPRHP